MNGWLARSQETRHQHARRGWDCNFDEFAACLFQQTWSCFAIGFWAKGRQRGAGTLKDEFGEQATFGGVIISLYQRTANQTPAGHHVVVSSSDRSWRLLRLFLLQLARRSSEHKAQATTRCCLSRGGLTNLCAHYQSVVSPVCNGWMPEDRAAAQEDLRHNNRKGPHGSMDLPWVVIGVHCVSHAWVQTFFYPSRGCTTKMAISIGTGRMDLTGTYRGDT